MNKNSFLGRSVQNKSQSAEFDESTPLKLVQRALKDGVNATSYDVTQLSRIMNLTT